MRLAQVDDRCFGVRHCFVPQVLLGAVIGDLAEDRETPDSRRDQYQKLLHRYSNLISLDASACAHQHAQCSFVALIVTRAADDEN